MEWYLRAAVWSRQALREQHLAHPEPSRRRLAAGVHWQLAQRVLDGRERVHVRESQARSQPASENEHFWPEPGALLQRGFRSHSSYRRGFSETGATGPDRSLAASITSARIRLQ